MIKDVYLFTNGTLSVFDYLGQEVKELSGPLTLSKQVQVNAQSGEGTRYIFARWKLGFFDLTKAEFMAAMIEDDPTDKEDPARQLLTLRFSTEGPVEGNEANRPR